MRCLRFLLHYKLTYFCYGLRPACLMSLITRQSEANKQGDGNSFGASARGCPPGLGNQRGFTLVELVMVMIIVGILAVFAAPRFFDADIFKSRGFSDQVQASLRYAQKIAIAQRRFVCVTIAGNSIFLATGTAATCGTPLASPSGGGNYVIDAPAGVTVTDASFHFKALGSPSAGVTVSVTGGDMTRNIIVEAETGYVHQ